MSTITAPSAPADQHAELRAADRERAALIRLTAAVVTMRAGRQLAPLPAATSQAGSAEP